MTSQPISNVVSLISLISNVMTKYPLFGHTLAHMGPTLNQGSTFSHKEPQLEFYSNSILFKSCPY